jgi:hypothetical protein
LHQAALPGGDLPDGQDASLQGGHEAEWEALVSRPEWRLACRVAASKGLSRSERLPRFLLYVCEQYLLGRVHEITEQRIGIQVFNRPSDYNPGEDNIVRSYARLLRKRLDLYFEGEGSGETMRIVIPRGGYVPVFQGVPQSEALIAAPSRANIAPNAAAASDSVLPGIADKLDDMASKTAGAWSTRRFAWSSTLVGLATGMLIATAGWLGLHALQAQKERGPADVVWRQLFQRNRNTLIVPSDSGLGVLQNLSGHLVGIEEYANGTYLSGMELPSGLDARNRNDLGRESYTSIVSLGIASSLAQLPEFVANRTQIRYARNMTTEDMRNSNVILLGSKYTNPWVSLFEKRLCFRLEYTQRVDESYVLNESPTGSEEKIYRNGTGSDPNHTYGSIAYLSSLDGTGHVLIIQGLNMAATQAAANILFHARAIEPVLGQATLPDGGLRSFELLVESTNIGASAPAAQIIATRIYPQ